jgi:cbb3-type cytochrome oxidase maturation protein
MTALFLLIGISMLVAGTFLAAFIWSVSDGQYDDDRTPSIRMLFEDREKESKTNITQ